MTRHRFVRGAREVLLTSGALLGVVCVVLTLAGVGWGVKPLIFRSGSMEPAISTGDMSLSRATDASDLQRGDIVSVITSRGSRVTHRIVDIAGTGVKRQLTLKGDANSSVDEETYTVSSVQRVGLTVPKAGYVVNAASSPVGLFILGLYVAGLISVIVKRPSGRSGPGDEHRSASGGDPEFRPEREHPGVERGTTRMSAGFLGRRALGSAGVLLSATLLSPFVFTTAAFTDDAPITSTTLGANKYFTCNAAIKSGNPSTPFFYYKLDGNANDSSGNGRTGTVTGGVTSATDKACTRDTGSSVLFDGTSGYGSSPVSPTSPNVFSIELWFKNGTSPGGRLIGYGNARTGSSASFDRHIYMTNTGQLVFGVQPSARMTIRSPSAYNNNQWHHVVATLSSAGMRLYVDGDQVASDPATTGARSIPNGFWRLGYDNLSGWANRPTTDYWKGTMDEAAVYYSAMSAAEVTAHYEAGR